MLTRPRTEPSTFGTNLAEMLVTPNLAQSTLKAGLAPRKAVTMILRLSRDLVLKASVQKGCIEVKGEDKEELNQVVFKGSDSNEFCGHEVDVKLCDVLYQPDYAGTDYEDGCENATVVCKALVDGEECEARQVTREGQNFESKLVNMRRKLSS